MHKIKLINSYEIPQIGLGTWQNKGKECYNAVKWALEIGYRHIDTAAIYENEVEVGKAIKDSKIKREEIFVTSKLWNADQGYETTKIAFQESLNKLQLDYLDLYLIHWPKSYEKTAQSWKAIEEFYESGLIKAIGVSNFKIHHMMKLNETAIIKPMINQIEAHVQVLNLEMLKYANVNDFKLLAYAPLMSKNVSELLNNNIITEIAHAHNKSNTQIALNYLISLGYVVLPKSIDKKRIEQNFKIFDFQLTTDEVAQLKTLNKEIKLFPDPDSITF